MKAYIAAGWFSDYQEECRQHVVQALIRSKWRFYSPKDHGIYIPGKTDPSEIFKENLKQIENCDLVVASTAGKDMGTLFECGYAYGLYVPIAYYFPQEGKFNLMLSESSAYVATSFNSLFSYLKYCQTRGKVKTNFVYKGEIE